MQETRCRKEVRRKSKELQEKMERIRMRKKVEVVSEQKTGLEVGKFLLINLSGIRYKYVRTTWPKNGS